MEDSKTQAMKLEYLLFKNGFEPLIAETGETAIKLAAERNPAVIISDIVMPQMSGYDFCRSIRNSSAIKDIPLILLTALSDTRDIIKGLECGASNFITKPYNDEYLIKQIRSLLENTALRTRDISEKDLQLIYEGNSYNISAGKTQILDILLSTYQTAIIKNEELKHAQLELKTLNLQLEEKVKEKTAHLMEEIRERKKAESEIYKLSNVVHQAKSIIVITDLDGNIEYANPRFTEVTGYTLSEAIGKNPRILKSGKHPDEMYQEIWETVLAGREWKGEMINRRKNGELYYENTSIFDIRDADGKVRNLAKISEDITQRKNDEIQLERLYASLMEDIELASSVQSYLLPDWLVHENNISVTSVYTPSEKVGGDIFDIIRISESQYVVYVGDISGHGVQAALIMTAVKSTINMLVNLEKNNLRPHFIINKLNEILSKDFFQNNYLTIIFCLFDLENNTIHYLNAGHPAIIEYNKINAETKIIDIVSSIPVGWLASYKYEEDEETRIPMMPDCIYFLYTDGLFECLNSEGLELGMVGFTSFLAHFREEMDSLILPFRIKQLLIDENYDLAGDDFTLLTVQKIGSSALTDSILLRYSNKTRKAVTQKYLLFLEEKFHDPEFTLTVNSIIANHIQKISDSQQEGKVDNPILLQLSVTGDLELMFWENTGDAVEVSLKKKKKEYILDNNFNKYKLIQKKYGEITETIIHIPYNK